MQLRTSPLRVGIIGSGFVAKLRAEILTADSRVELVAIAGNPERVGTIAQTFSLEACGVADLISRPDLDLIVVATVNRDHGKITQQVLHSGKSAIVEYPLALDFREAKALVDYAQTQNLLLHIEHIELLGGVHQATMAHLAQIGTPLFASYTTQTPQNPAPDKWTYMPSLFGFPLTASVSRIHRLTHLFGKVASVSAQLSYRGDALPQLFSSCICQAQLRFANGLIAEVGYSKGEHIWRSQRSLEIQGSLGGIFFEGEVGKLITAAGEIEIAATAPRGLFKQDTESVLDHLFTGSAIYTTSSSALGALEVAEAAEKAAASHEVIFLP